MTSKPKTNKKSEERMMLKKLGKEEKEFTINLATIEGDGSFPCPKCGMAISPEDETENNYQILDTKVTDNELSELLIACGKCGSTIKITGFQAEL